MASSVLPTLISSQGSSICISRKAAVGNSIGFSPSSIRFSRKAAIGTSICINSPLRKSVAQSAPSINLLGDCGARINTTSQVSDDKSSTPHSRTSPWLMLPPTFEGGDMVYNLYSLAEDKVLSFNKSNGGPGEKQDSELMPDDDAEFVGSSHGWLFSYNREKGDLFLSDPLSRRHIKLPSPETLPEEERWGCGGMPVQNVIISCPPDEQDCVAMMIYAPPARLAFCYLGHSTEWTPIGELYQELYGRTFARSYCATVYSTSQKLFLGITSFGDFEAWDVHDPLSPRMISMAQIGTRDWQSEEETELKSKSVPSRSLVVAEHSDDLFHVTWFTVRRMGPDGSFVKDVWCGSRRGYDRSLPYKTIDFDVHKYDKKDGAWKYMDSSLDGLAFFIGENHGFALPASEFPELKPDTIYFTDIKENYPSLQNYYGGHDIGIFHYENKTISPCYYPCDYQSIRKIVPEPLWFTPNPF